MKMPFSPVDLAAIALFALAWVVYSLVSARLTRSRTSLLNVLEPIRDQWMRNALRREVRILDGNLMGTLMQSATFFASTTILILGGLVAGLGSIKDSVGVVEHLPFAAKGSAELMEMKLLTLIGLFMYAFVKFSWSVRQFNFASILIGAMPEHKEVTPADMYYADRVSKINALAGDNFTKGLRAYYFAMPVLLWFINPVLFILGTILVVAMIYRMEFHSRTLEALMHK
jgi:uncharacterized membrane protein